MRPFWYMKMNMLKDEEVQKKGIVCVSFCNSNVSIDLKFLEEKNLLELSLPYRTVSIHFCYLNPDVRMLAAGLKLFIDNATKGRVRTHSGSRDEISFKLQTFGIPAEACQMDSDKEAGREEHVLWLEGLQAQEEQGGEVRADMILTPRKMDVLFGKHTKAKEHTGNMRAHALVEEHFDDYEHANKARKTEIANFIIKCIHNTGGKFLKQEIDGMWVEVSDTVARQKIAHWYRHLRHKVKKNIQPNTKTAFEFELTIPKRVSPEPSPIDPSFMSPDKMLRIW